DNITRLIVEAYALAIGIASSFFLPSIEQAKRNHMSSNHAATRRRR
ncbi:hypothetical protein JMJ77_0013317, partial [Colletotrichum scovillei]